MALKDWKKTSQGFENKKQGDTLFIYKEGNIFRKNYNEKSWNLQMSIGNKILFKIFKSKSQALKFAKSYMRTH